MTQTADMVRKLVPRIAALPYRAAGRRFVAVAGPPACGKSTLSAALVAGLREAGLGAGLVAMDGFHLDNAILDARGLRARKGAPETFDLNGFAALLARLNSPQEVIAPTFDRARDVSVGASTIISADVTHVVVEGNYLLLDCPGWRDLSRLWDVSVSLAAPFDVLKERLVQRWLDHGLSARDALAKASENDLPNAKLVCDHSLPADIVISSTASQA